MKDLVAIDAKPLKGGCVTARDKALLPFGAFSMLQNVRNTQPGLMQRLGQRKLHSTADSTNKVLSLYQFRKTYVNESHFFAQMSDGDVLEATNLPPAATVGVFGSEVFDGSADQIPAAWGSISDLMLHSNGKDQHQIYGGTSSPVERFIVGNGLSYTGIADVPQGGQDFSDHIQNATDSRVAILDSLAHLDTLWVRTPVPCTGFGFTVNKPNGTTCSMTVKYWKNDKSWASVSGISDGTVSGGASLAQTGAVTWTAPTDMVPKYAFGSCGYWYLIHFDAQLDSEVELSAVTFTSEWVDIENVWDGGVIYGVEVHLEGDSTWETYAAGAVDLSEFASGKKMYIAFADPVEGIYFDVGGTPNATGTGITSIKYWTGSDWQSVGTVTDGSAGLSQTGWATFPRCPAEPLQLHTSIYQAYWYEIIWNAEILADTVISVQGMPYFDITELGKGYCNAIWKDRACYTFDEYGSYVYITAKDSPLTLNGGDYGILKAGDGRANRIVAMRRFHNELMVWQEELGVEGGCLTLFEGYSPTTFGKLVLSSKIGTMNNKCVAIIDGVLTSTKTDESIKTLAFSLSRYGVCVSDGMTVSIVSDDIGNYFDPTKAECIRFGYEKEMWLEHDMTHNVIRIGLVSGATATLPNVFPVFDLATKTWSFDTPAQEISCVIGIEPGSGQAPVVMVGGGIDDGTVYQLNYGAADVDQAIRAYGEIVLNHKALVLNLHEILVRCASRIAGSFSLSVYEGERWKFTKQLPMTPEHAEDKTRRHRFSCDATSDLMTIAFSHSSNTQGLDFHEIGMAVRIWERR